MAPWQCLQTVTSMLNTRFSRIAQLIFPRRCIEEAHLLYFIVKNHPFTDGNKRIGAFMFIWFLQRNKHHLKKSGEPKINDNALVAITLLVAQSEPCQKEIMVELIVNLIREEQGS